MRRLSRLFALLTAMIFLVGPGSPAGKKPGGGANILLQAVFSDSVINAASLAVVPCKIQNDAKNPTIPYTSLAGTNGIYILAPSQSGELIMSVVAKSRRAVRMTFDDGVSPPASSPQICGDPYALFGREIETTYFWLRTRDGFQVATAHNEDGSVRMTEFTPIGGILNLAQMAIGEIRGVKLANNFQFPGSTLYFTIQAPFYVLVKATDLEGDGVMDWVLTPVFGPLRIWDSDAEIWTEYPDGSCLCPLRSNVSPDCDYGTFRMPFEVKVSRLQ